MNGILDLIKTRQSCRSYSGRDVEREKLQKILEAGRLSPSARNSQPWYLTLAVSAEKVAAVGECTRAGGKNAFTDICRNGYLYVRNEYLPSGTVLGSVKLYYRCI